LVTFAGEWRKSTRSDGPNDCVELAPLVNGGAAIRDTKNREQGMLVLDRPGWAAFLKGVKTGEFA
jgi:uncharacterized protein DUF397